MTFRYPKMAQMGPILAPKRSKKGQKRDEKGTFFISQDQDGGPQERKKKAKTHLPGKGCARRARAQEKNASSVKSKLRNLLVRYSSVISPPP